MTFDKRSNFLVIRPGNRKPRKRGTDNTADKGT